jgi:hypothetical protein
MAATLSSASPMHVGGGVDDVRNASPNRAANPEMLVEYRGRAFDLTGSYETVLVRLAIAMFACGALMPAMPRYQLVQPASATTA